MGRPVSLIWVRTAARRQVGEIPAVSAVILRCVALSAETLTHSVTPKRRGPPVASAMGHKTLCDVTHQFPRLIQLSSALLVLRLFRLRNARRRLSRQRRL
jgi:hypothetical protein